MRRGTIWWADLGAPIGSAPGFERPFLIVSGNRLNESAIATVIVASITSNLRFEVHASNFRIPSGRTGLSLPSVVLLHQLTTVDKRSLSRKIGRIPDDFNAKLDAGLRLLMGLV